MSEPPKRQPEGPPQLEQRVLLLAPTARDAAITAAILSGVGIACTTCTAVGDMCAEMAGGAGALLLTEEVLASGRTPPLAALLRDQPPWSDLPVVVLVSGGANSPAGLRAMQLLGNVTILERPVQTATLVSVMRTLLRARHRQYQLREHVLERERAAEAMKLQASVLENMTEGVSVSDASGVILYTNPAEDRMFGYEPGELVGKHVTVQNTYDPEENSRIVGEVIERLKATGAWFGEFSNRKKDGTPFTTFAHITALDVGGKVHRVCVQRDITEEKKAEQERERLLVSERAARNEAERAGRMKDEFLATLSHELRTPLNAILGWSQILQSSGATAEDLQQGLETIGRNARVQAQIIEDLLDMSRIISGKVRLDVQRVDLPAVIEAALDTVRPGAEAKGVRLQTVLDPRAGLVSGDPNRLQQVFWNLLSNAIKFTPRGGRVQVVLERVESSVEASVIDSGEGIKPEFLPHVFDRFRQEDSSTTRRHGGLGLGLAIVKQLVELHGGSIRARSEGPGKGAAFVVSLPVTVLQPPAPAGTARRYASPQQAPPAPRAESAGLNGVNLAGVNVLVVDDEADARVLVRRLLEDCDANVTTACSAEEALAAIAAAPPDVLVSDIGMPGADGFTLIERVRALGKSRGGDLPAVALTAYARSEDRTRSIRAGYQTHVSKPVEPAELLATIASLTGRTGGAREA